MADFDWKAIVRMVAPAVASVFGTPLAGLGVKALVDAILPSGDPQPTDPESYLQDAIAKANPEVMLKIKQADQQFTLDMRKLDIDLERVGNEDRDRASKMATADSEHVAAKLTYFVVGAFTVTAAFVGILAVTRPAEEPSAYVAGLIGTIVGAIVAYMTQAMNFHMGKNTGSERTKEMLFKSTSNGK